MSIVEDIMSIVEDIISTVGDIMSIVEDIISTVGDVQYCGGITFKTEYLPQYLTTFTALNIHECMEVNLFRRLTNQRPFNYFGVPRPRF